MDDILLRLNYAKQQHGRNRSDRRTILAAAESLKSRAGRAIARAKQSVSDASKGLCDATRRYEEVALTVRELRNVPVVNEHLIPPTSNAYQSVRSSS